MLYVLAFVIGYGVCCVLIKIHGYIVERRNRKKLTVEEQAPDLDFFRHSRLRAIGHNASSINEKMARLRRDRWIWDRLVPGTKELKDWTDVRIARLAGALRSYRFLSQFKLRKKLKTAHDRIEKLEKRILALELKRATHPAWSGKPFTVAELRKIKEEMGKYPVYPDGPRLPKSEKRPRKK